MIRVLWFDCFGVLARKGTWDDFKASLPADVDYAVIQKLHDQLDSGTLSQDDFLHQMHYLTGHEPELIEETLQPNSLKNYGLLRYITQLRQKNYQTGIISNIATDWVRQDFLTQEEQALFDAMVFSYEVGATKPHPEIFQVACDQLNAQPEECVLIDDSSFNAAGARDFGMHAVEFQSLEQLKKQLALIIVD